MSECVIWPKRKIDPISSRLCMHPCVTVRWDAAQGNLWSQNMAKTEVTQCLASKHCSSLKHPCNGPPKTRSSVWHPIEKLMPKVLLRVPTWWGKSTYGLAYFLLSSLNWATVNMDGNGMAIHVTGELWTFPIRLSGGQGLAAGFDPGVTQAMQTIERYYRNKKLKRSHKKSTVKNWCCEKMQLNLG